MNRSHFVSALIAVLFLPLPALAPAFANDAADPNLYLEQARGAQALSWVRAENAKTLPRLQNDSAYAGIRAKIARIALAKDRVPVPSLVGNSVYNFWQDETSVRGVLRRTSLDDYARANPSWETILDLDALAKSEHENWVWKGETCLQPDYRRCMIELSRGGQDASVLREFDMTSKAFVPGGFNLPEAKSTVAWLDADHLLVATDFGPDSLTDSGYPRIVKLWTRGTPLSSATTLFAGSKSDIEMDASVTLLPGGPFVLITEGTTFFTNNLYRVDPSSFEVRQIPVPADSISAGVFGDQFLLQLRTEWKTGGAAFPAGSLVSIPIAGLDTPKPSLVYAPDAESAIEDIAYTRNAVYVSILHDVKGRLLKFTRGSDGWNRGQVPVADSGSITLLPSDRFGDTLLLEYSSFLVPPTVLAVEGGTGTDSVATLRRLPDRFDASPYLVEQLFSTSKDGTRIPYFVIRRKNLAYNGKNPTLLYGYGGFEVSMTPFYLGSIGKVWLDAGGVYVLANIRGGGEFGPKWHEAAILTHRQRAYDDFISVAEDLIARRITSPRRLGIEGGSNGGLLVGATFVERPELFHAVVCQVPLLDMIRYPLLGAGASWEGEYGDPSDPVMRAAILGYSPYQNLKPKVRYPEVFFETSTEDDRVTPAHARKMAALMEEQGHPFLFYENTEGGHAADANLNQTIDRDAREFTYLFQTLLR